MLHFEDRMKFEELSDIYDHNEHRRKQRVEFFCRLINTVVDDVRPSGIVRVDEDGDDADEDQ